MFVSCFQTARNIHLLIVTKILSHPHFSPFPSLLLPSPPLFHHSSGAVSCLLAAALQGRGYSIDHVTVFGTPKFTDKKGAVRLVETLPIERVEHVMDPVSIAPMVCTYVQMRYSFIHY